MSRRKLVYVAKDRQRIRNIAEREIRVERFEVDFPFHVRVLQERLDLGTEHERAAGRDGVVKRFLSNAVARDEHFALFLVPDCEGKHAAQVLHASRAVLFIAMNDRFRIGVGLECVTVFFEIGSQLLEVIDFAVEDDRDCAVFAGDRLSATREINDGEASHSERNAVFYEKTVIVRTAMPYTIAHALEQASTRGGVNWVSFPVIYKSGDSAHMLIKSQIHQ